MEYYTLVMDILIFLFGVTIGSFLNVVIYRFGSGRRLSGRSKCLSCGKTLKAYMLVPLFSFLATRGRCGYCKTKLSIQYPFVELTLGVLFVVIAHVHQLSLFSFNIEAWIFALLDMAIWSALLVIGVYDMKHKIIPDRFVLYFALLAGVEILLRSHWGLLHVPYIPFLNSVPPWIDFAAAPLLAIPFALLWFFSGGRAMGLGDAKLAFGMGWFLGFSGGVSAVIFAFWIAFIPSIILLLLPEKHFTMKSEIPFGPFLLLGTALVYSCGFDILVWSF